MKNPNSKKVTIIIPVYNVKNYLDRTFNSVKTQSYDNIEIIFIDDGSTDGSGEKCEWFAKEDKRVKVYHQNNRGSSVARNVGLEKMTGDYVTFVDADDYVEPDYIESFVKIIDEDDCPVIVQEGLDASGYGYVPYDDVSCRVDSIGWYEYMMTEKISTGVVAKMLPAEMAKQVRFDNDYSVGEDIYYYYSIINSQNPVDVVIDSSIKKYHYCRRENSLTIQNNSIKSWNNNIAVFRAMMNMASSKRIKISATKGLYLILISILIRNLKSKDYNKQYGVELHRQLKKLGVIIPNNQNPKRVVRIIAVRYLYTLLRLVYLIIRRKS